MFHHLPFLPELSSTNVTYITSFMCLFMCKRNWEHCHVKYVENYSRKKGNCKTHAKKHKYILVPSQNNHDSRHLLQNPKVPRNVIGVLNPAHKFSSFNYLSSDSLFLQKVWQGMQNIACFSFLVVLKSYFSCGGCLHAFQTRIALTNKKCTGCTLLRFSSAWILQVIVLVCKI